MSLGMIKLIIFILAIGLASHSEAQDSVSKDSVPTKVVSEDGREKVLQIQHPNSEKGLKSISADGVYDYGTGDEKVLNIEHPESAKGLQSISKEKVYQYKLKERNATQSSTLAFNASSSWNFSTDLPNGNSVKYTDVYSSSTFISLSGCYEWFLSRKYGGISLVFESGIGTAQGHAVFEDGTSAKETFQFVMIPVTPLLKYRFQFRRHQWVAPYVEVGGTYVGMLELRSDSKKSVAGSEAFGGGGGLMFNISRFNAESSFLLNQDYGIADFWLILGARQWVGVKKSLDLTNTLITAGIAVDY